MRKRTSYTGPLDSWEEGAGAYQDWTEWASWSS
eukprot:CAMPEP_0196723468 /NCGR_PEP_ID=MMETSP1091-20130531/5580_1 /TAXON_ID=302021 /ORGANISM="Rhodomonas sp., Strain CCMP768" /LENGTH=32 /DNA_ID= /DNA_START= /DNA_END= /DNA_ORIENTATION=